MKKTLHLIFILCLSFPLCSFSQGKNPGLKVYEDSLKTLGRTIVGGIDEDAKKEATYKFIPLLVRALKLPGSFDYPFDSVKTMRITMSPDHKFRIFNWFVSLNGIAFRFYGAIQMNSPGKLQLYPLLDYTENISKPDDTVTDAKKWYGSEYYTILPPDQRGYYLLIGWKGMTEEVKSRLVDVLHFENGKAVFGAPIFTEGKDVHARLIFRHKTDVTMKLNYLSDKNEIIMEHLAPPDPKLKGKYEAYGPDGTYDALVDEGGLWVLKEDVKVQNEESEKDKSFIQPEKAPVIQ